MSHYSSLEGQRQTIYGRYSETAGSLFVSVKINGLGHFLKQLTLQTSTAFGHLKSCWEGHHISHTCTLRETVGWVKEFTWVMTLGTTLHKWEPMEVKYSKFGLLDLLGSSEI